MELIIIQFSWNNMNMKVIYKLSSSFIIVLQDIFPAIFAYLFQDPRLLESKVEPTTLDAGTISGAAVVDGVIEGGIHSGEPLFTGGND